MNHKETRQDITELRRLAALSWTPKQEEKLTQAFARIDEVLFELEQDHTRLNEKQAISGIRADLERIVTGFSLKYIFTSIDEGSDDNGSR